MNKIVCAGCGKKDCEKCVEIGGKSFCCQMCCEQYFKKEKKGGKKKEEPAVCQFC